MQPNPLYSGVSAWVMCLMLLLLLHRPAQAEYAVDSLRLFDSHELAYHSPMEAAAFACVASEQECDMMMLAMATDPVMRYDVYEMHRTGFYQFLDSLKSERNFRRGPRRQVPFIFEAIHAKYFREYQANPLFSHIFGNGDYNCITASVLFALAFDHFDIPYRIIMIPDHVYLLAYPEGEGIIVETTNPLRGAHLAIGSRERAHAVRQLVDMKLVTQQEVDQKGADQVFSQVYLSRETPTLLQLIGALYHNQALGAAGMRRYVLSYELFKKSSFLYPRLSTTGSMMTYAWTVVTQGQYHQRETCRVLAEMEKFMVFELPAQVLIDQSLAFLNTALRAGHFQVMDSVYTWLHDGFSNNLIKDELKFGYHFNRAVILGRKQQPDAALEYLTTALELKPYDHNANRRLNELLFSMLYANHPAEEMYVLVKELAERFEHLAGNKSFRVVQQLVLLEMMNRHYVMHYFDQAEHYRKTFEQAFGPGSIEADETLQYLEKVYSRASLHYYRENQVRGARAVLTSGLQYIPGSFELQSKLDALP
jgi:tetratricopeptide (TPR) repeat protein